MAQIRLTRRSNARAVTALAALALVLASCGASSGDNVAPLASSEDTTTTVVESAAEEIPEDDSEEITEEAPEEPESDRVVGTRTEPLAQGSLADLGSWSVSVLEFIPDATQQVAAGNQFNEPAPAGMVYTMARLGATYTDTDPQSSTAYWSLSSSLVGADSVSYSETDCGASLGPSSLSNQPEQFTNGSIEGYVCFLVPVEQVNAPGSAILVKDTMQFAEASEAWFAPVPGEGVASAPYADSSERFVPDPSATAGSRGAPHPLGSVVSLEDWDVAVTEFVPDATEFVMDGNMFNEAAPEGFVYSSARVAATYTSADPSSSNAYYSMTLYLVGENNIAYSSDSCGASLGDGSLSNAPDVFTGGTVEGIVCFLSPLEQASAPGSAIRATQSFADLEGWFTRS